MRTRRLLLSVSALGWIGFILVTLWTVAFLARVGVARGVDGPPRVGAPLAVLTDVGLLALFGVQHSVMARRRSKAWLRHVVPAALERTTYVLAADLALALLLVCWQPFGVPLWRVEGAAAAAFWLLYAGGWGLAVAATFAVDHLELTGLRQAGWFGAGDGPSRTGLRTDGLYAVVRHPLMTGLLVAVWSTPRMGASHLLFAVGMTAYVGIGVRFEERELRRTFGAEYEAYAARVPALVPSPVRLVRLMGRRIGEAQRRGAE
ncbi:MAG: methyltransferase family protein [Amnibacterium sp.]